MLEKANQLLRRQHELKAKMSETMRYRSDSVVSIDEPALQLGLNGEAVMEEAVLEMLQTNNVEELRKVDADALALATTAKTYALHEACEAGSMDVVRFLLEEAEHDIDIRKRSNAAHRSSMQAACALYSIWRTMRLCWRTPIRRVRGGVAETG